MSTNLESRELAPDAWDEWDALVASSPDGSIYSETAYLDTLCRAGGGRFRVVAVRRGGELAGGVALYERASRFGSFVAPRLLLYGNGIVLRRWEGKYPSIEAGRHVAIMEALVDHLDRMGLGSVNLRNQPSVADVRPFLARGWKATPGYTYLVPLSDLKAQWGRVEQNLRRLVRRCEERDGLQVTEDTDIEAFLRLHEVTLGRRGLASYLPAGAFRDYFRTLHAQGMARLYHARLPDGDSVACQLVLLSSNGTSQTVSAGGDPAHQQLGAPAFLRWRVFESLAAAGFRSNDLTDASLNSVTRFKAQLGGDLALTLVLQSPRSPGFAAGTGALRGIARARARLGNWVRSVGKRGEPTPP